MLKFPTIHLNGTSGEYLADALREAHDAIVHAARALDECAPNARDYYPQGDEAFGIAAREHRARADALRKVEEELLEVELAIQEQLDARKAARR